VLIDSDERCHTQPTDPIGDDVHVIDVRNNIRFTPMITDITEEIAP